MDEYFCLDLETAPIKGDLSNGYALEPWRVRQKTAKISSISVTNGNDFNIQVTDPSRDTLIDILNQLKGKIVIGHNLIFDNAWLIASINPNRLDRIPKCVMDIRWRDSMLLAKWVTNGRKADDARISYSLSNLCKMFLKDEPGLNEFIQFKSSSVLDPSSPYWAERGMLDVKWTLKLYRFLIKYLPAQSERGFVIEQRAIPSLANSWLIGIRVDSQALRSAEQTLLSNVAEGCKELGVAPEILSSPTQLGNMLYNRWGFSPIKYTATGKPSTAADDIILLAYQSNDARLRKILQVRQSMTLLSKYIKVAYEALARTSDGHLYGVPRIFGTTSGRLTYSNDTLGNKVSIANHQIPRKDKLIRRYLTPPEGSNIFECDAASQESRIMGIWSSDSEIIRVFNQGINFHTNMASHIYGRAYAELDLAVKNEDYTSIEQRQMGKLTNLACNFRIGGKNLAKKSLTEYDVYMTEDEGRKLTQKFRTLYPGVPAYWTNIIQFAKQNGYTYTLAGRRYKVPQDMLLGSDAWKVEGTIISHPIQGTGADMFLAAISQVPDARIITNLHDGIFFAVESQEEANDIFNRMQATDYQSLWQLDHPLSIPLVYEPTKLGTSFADVK